MNESRALPTCSRDPLLKGCCQPKISNFYPILLQKNLWNDCNMILWRVCDRVSLCFTLLSLVGALIINFNALLTTALHAMHHCMQSPAYDFLQLGRSACSQQKERKIRKGSQESYAPRVQIITATLPTSPLLRGLYFFWFLFLFIYLFSYCNIILGTLFQKRTSSKIWLFKLFFKLGTGALQLKMPERCQHYKNDDILKYTSEIQCIF